MNSHVIQETKNERQDPAQESQNSENRKTIVRRDIRSKRPHRRKRGEGSGRGTAVFIKLLLFQKVSIAKWFDAMVRLAFWSLGQSVVI